MLCFHRITDDVNYVWPAVPVMVFRKIMMHLKKHYEVILPSGYEMKTSKPKAIVTFDDGFHDFMEYAVPVLTDLDLPAVHHVVVESVMDHLPNWTYRINLVVEDHLKSGKSLSISAPGISFEKKVDLKNAEKVAMNIVHLMKDIPITGIKEILAVLERQCEGDLYFPAMMNQADLNQCLAANIEIGSHGWTHTLLNNTVSTETLQHEIADSKLALEKMIGRRVTCFAFPAAVYDDRAMQMAKLAGYDFIFEAGDRFFTSEAEQKLPVVFPRIIPPTRGADVAILKIEGLHSHIKNRSIT